MDLTTDVSWEIGDGYEQPFENLLASTGSSISSSSLYVKPNADDTKIWHPPLPLYNTE